MAKYLSISIGTTEVANQVSDDGEMLADLINEIGYSVDGTPHSRVLAEFAENLDDDGRKVLAALATAAGLIPEADHVE